MNNRNEFDCKKSGKMIVLGAFIVVAVDISRSVLFHSVLISIRFATTKNNTFIYCLPFDLLRENIAYITRYNTHCNKMKLHLKKMPLIVSINGVPGCYFSVRVLFIST